jgi:cytochrome b6-f complex iron-sulfur subunit
MDYVLKGVNEKYKDRQRVWIVGEEDDFCALFAKCTHQGCTPRWLSAANKFKCPCHGSGFYKDRTNFECPAPRRLDRFKIELGEVGQLLVDKGRLHHMNARLDPDEQYPDSIIKA